MIAIFTGVSGLRAHQFAANVIANNIANINTIAFKAGRVSFQDALSQTLRPASAPTEGGRGGVNPSQVGLGVTVGSINNLMAQGNLKPTGRVTDMAIEGAGYFIMGDAGGMYFTRDGVFELDASNTLVHASTGMKLLGWRADPATGEIQASSMLTPQSELTIPLGGKSVARPTSEMTYQNNLDANAAIGDEVMSTCYIYDSLGNSHRMDLTFQKTAANEWSWSITSPDADPAAPPSTGTLQFGTDGQVDPTSMTGSFTLDLADPNGADDPIVVDISFGDVTQLVGQSTIQMKAQDGLPMGTLQSFYIDQSGLITGNYTNGMFERLGQIALASFANAAGLEKLGGNLYAQSTNSGLPTIVKPGTADSGNLASGHLEMSNVDLAEEFANLIVISRGFQANSRVITTGDEMLQELLNVKR
jgi:flagellar hook protein FlgE